MGIFSFLSGGILGQATDAVKGIAGVFTSNKEADAQRLYDLQNSETNLISSAQSQYAAEFLNPAEGIFGRFVNALNRLPRPTLALGTIGLFGYAVYDPVDFTTIMVGLQAVPLELWGLMGSITAFYFGSRHFEKKRSETLSVEKLSHLLRHQREVSQLNPNPQNPNTCLLYTSPSPRDS